MSDPQHSELEAKYDANGLTLEKFESFVGARSEMYPQTRKITVVGTDIYYEHRRDVVRQRIGEDHHELTVKVRKSKKQIQDRHEVDLTIAAKSRPVDAQQFLKLIGFKDVLSLVKTSYIYFFRRAPSIIDTTRPEKDQYVDFDVAIYDVTLSPPGLHPVRRFLEVEIHKESPLTQAQREEELLLLKESLYLLNIGEPLNESLYEIYSGKKYRIQKG